VTFSPEQEAILDREGSFCINATAGSGKTTTLCAWASLYSTKSTIALTYNGSSKADMIRKRDSLGITNLAVESIHSLAQKGVFRPNNRPKTFELSLTSSKVVELLKLQDLPGKENSCYLLGKWTSRVLSFFLNSTVASFDDLVPEYFIEESFDPDFVNNFDIIVKGSSTIYELMKSQKIPMLHDVYLKMFWQLGHNIPHDAVLFDEGQDASPIMLDIFLRQEGLTKIIVGDEHQQIYSWRYARNALDSTGLDKMFLTSCFRFSSRISKLANEVLEWKRKLGIPFSTPPLTGCRENYPNPFPECYSSGIIARTNTGLLSTAIRLLADDHPCMKSISFEGNFESYKFAENGESIYDVLNVFDGKREFIKSPMLKNMRSFSELKNYCLLANDSSLSMQVSLVEKYKKDIIRYMKELTEKNKKQNNQPPDLMFSTAHKSKGMEYEEVSLADDFMLFNELQDKLTRREISQARACEEINLLYVSITRSKGLAWVSPRLNDSLGQSKI
jgi:F-box protein 18 (helicase)